MKSYIFHMLLRKRVIRGVVFAWVIMIMPIIFYSQATVFTINEYQAEYDLNNHIEILEDRPGTLSIDSILSGVYDSLFFKLSDDTDLDPSYSYWLRVMIDNHISDMKEMVDWRLFIGETDLIEFYQVDALKQIVDSKMEGSLRPTMMKSLTRGNKFNRVPISLRGAYPITLYTKISRITNEGFLVDMKLSKFDFHQSWDFLKQTRMYWLFLGFLVTIFIFNLFFYVENRDKAFLYHALFIAGVFGIVLEYFAITHDLAMVRERPFLKQVVDYSSLAIMDFAYYQFIRYYLNLGNLIPRWEKILKQLIYLKLFVYPLIIILYLATINIPLTDKIFASFIISQYIVIAIFLIPLYRMKDKKGMFLLVGSVFMFLGVILNGISVIIGTGIYFIYTLFGIAGEITSFSLGLGYRMKELRNKAIEEEKATVKKLREIDQLKNQFLANTSHELKTPLQGIIGLSENLLEFEKDASKAEELSLIINSGKRLQGLIQDILDFSRLKNHDLVLNRKRIHLSTLVEIVLSLMKPYAENKNIQLVNKVRPELPSIYGDENRLQQVLFNLIHNAVKFTYKGYVSVDAREKENYIEVLIKDTGIGIPSDKKEIIFEEFQQVDGSISREFPGSGLGLSISRQLVELHGGSITLDSKVGEGSVFKFSVPIFSDEIETSEIEKITSTSYKEERLETSKSYAQTEVVTKTYQKEEFPENAYTILIVDDEPINQRVLSNHLMDSIYRVHFASDGKEALRYIDHHPEVDLILLDLMLPKMSGYEVCKRIREKYLPSQKPIIMVTAKNQLIDLIQGFEVGANDYISKPFSKNEFLARVKTQLNLYNYSRITDKYVPVNFIKELGREAITEVQVGDHVQKKITVLFSDIRGYTTIAEKLNLNETFSFVGDHVSAMGPLIVENNGFVSQYFGDGIMALFPYNPENALNASISMQKLLLVRNAKKNPDHHELNVGIGFHTGNLMMGIIGDQYHNQPVTIADTVNIASRIEALNKHFGSKILLSNSSLQEIPNIERYNLRYIGEIKVKGKSNQIGLYECFDGDEEKLIIKKKESKSHFDEGIKLYQKGDFPRAAVSFQEILNANPEDHVVKYYLQRSADQISRGASADWSGIEVFDFK